MLEQGVHKVHSSHFGATIDKLIMQPFLNNIHITHSPGQAGILHELLSLASGRVSHVMMLRLKSALSDKVAGMQFLILSIVGGTEPSL